jgi:hypothetical protein
MQALKGLQKRKKGERRMVGGGSNKAFDRINKSYLETYFGWVSHVHVGR